MRILEVEEMKKIIGGASGLTGTLVSAIRGYISVILGVGQAVGGAIRRIKSGNLCSF